MRMSVFIDQSSGYWDVRWENFCDMLPLCILHRFFLLSCMSLHFASHLNIILILNKLTYFHLFASPFSFDNHKWSMKNMLNVIGASSHHLYMCDKHTSSNIEHTNENENSMSQCATFTRHPIHTNKRISRRTIEHWTHFVCVWVVRWCLNIRYTLRMYK